jgi:hypothetical protein
MRSQTYGGAGDQVHVGLVHPAVAVEVPCSVHRAAGLDAPGQPESIEDVHAAAAIYVGPTLRQDGTGRSEI